MFAKSVTLAFVAVATLGAATVPAAAEAQPRGYYQQDRYDRGYAQNGYGSGYGYGYDDGYQNVRYRQDGRRTYRNSYRGGGRCYDKGNGGLAIGAIAGGLLGNAVVGRRGDGTLGAVIGAGVGALAGRSIDKSDGRPC